MPATTPVRYDPSVERIADDEHETIESLKETLLKISSKVHEDSGHALRSVHAKPHGLLHGELRVLDNLPPELAQGIFAAPRTYPVLMRLSTPAGDVLDDSVSLPRGLALKVLGVDGERLPGSESDTTQDFVMVNGPAFLAPDAQHFLKNLKLLAATTDKGEGWKKALSTVLRGTEKVIETLGSESGKIKSMGGHPMTNMLGETYFTQVPMRFGDYIGKLSVAPVLSDLAVLKDQPLDLKAKPDGLRDAVRSHFRDHGGEWEVRVQLCTDLKAMPVEDASVEWPQEQSPYVVVARITAPRQVSWDESASPAADDRLSFSPWHGVTAHQPLGSVMRARKEAYAASVQFRGSRNGCPMHQPKSVGDAVPSAEAGARRAA
jgi:hypothetical protein